MKATASDWIKTDINAIRDDIKRLGLDGATEYQMELINDRTEAGDLRWEDVTEEDMRKALEMEAE